MSLLRNQNFRAGRVIGVYLPWMAMAVVALAQTISTTTVQGTVYTANGAPGSGTATVTVQIGSTASIIQLTASDAAKFAPGSMIAADVDYTGQTGFVGSPVSGAYLRQPLTDVDYIRRVTFNVGLVLGVSSASLILAQPLPGGAPAAGTKLQAITGFVDREGGTFYHEWSALFVMQGSQGDCIFFHYPRLQSVAGAEESAIPLDSKHKGGLARILLKGNFLALPVTDPLDGERVLCYRSFKPAAYALI